MRVVVLTVCGINGRVSCQRHAYNSSLASCPVLVLWESHCQTISFTLLFCTCIHFSSFSFSDSFICFCLFLVFSFTFFVLNSDLYRDSPILYLFSYSCTHFELYTCQQIQNCIQYPSEHIEFTRNV